MRRALVPFFSLVACGTPSIDVDSAEPEGLLRACWFWYDGDGDGFGSAAGPRLRTPGCLQPPGFARNPHDCDDGASDVSPGALEWCNDVDDDCDGDVDTYAQDEAVWYRDADGDGFGRFAITQLSCDPLPGYASEYGDCSDNNPARSPGAEEVCNGVDDDCDGRADDEDPNTSDQPTWYADEDADGHGTPATQVIACSYTGGSLVDDDCDDEDAAVYAGATDVCGDGVDQDCDGSDAVCGSCALPSGTSSLLEADARVYGAMGWKVGDVDGDGWPELVAADGSDDTNGAEAGVVYAIPVPVAGDATTGDAVAVIYGAEAEDRLSTVDLGDVDQDGHLDLWMGAIRSSNGAASATELGSVNLVLGPASGTSDLTTADATWVGEYLGGYWGSVAGTSVNVVDDQTGDGLPDLLLSDNRGNALTGVGYLVDGAVRGTNSLSGAFGRWLGAYGDRVGHSTAGDIDGDGIQDLIFGATDDNDNPSADGGQVFVRLGTVAPGTAALSGSDVVLNGEAAYDYAGGGLATSDLTGDGVDDLLVGAWGSDLGGTNAGVYYVVSSPPAGVSSLAASHARLIGSETDAGFGETIAPLGDVDGDGYADVAVGAAWTDGCGVDSGAVYLFRGPIAGDVPASSATRIWVGEPGQRAGYRVGAADVDADGEVDLLVTAISDEVGGPPMTFVIYGPLL